MDILLPSWRIWIIIISGISLLLSITTFILGKYITCKIFNNDLHHINQDIEVLKKEDKDFKIELKNEIHNIFLAIKRIEKKQTIRDTVCEERHSRKNNKR